MDRRRVSVKGVSALRFVLSESVLQNASVNPANLDYHMTRGHGVLPLSTVYQNVPLVATKPHFLDTYPSLEARGRSMGLAPTQADHDTYLDVEPNTGLPLRFHKRLMFSLDVGPVTLPTMKSTAQLVPKMAPGFFPLIWGDENFVINQEDADELHTMRTASHLVNNVLPIVIAASAGAAILLMVAYGFVVARAGTAGARVGPPYSAL